MKNVITYPSNRNAPKAPQSRFNHFIDLVPFQKMIERILVLIQAQMHVVDMTEMYRLFARKAKEEKAFEKAKMHNFKTGLKWNMLRRVKWREKVLEDLGGEEALVKWEAKAAKSETKVPKPYKTPVYKRPPLASLRMGVVKLSPPRSPFDVKTDESGSFRLAPIPTARPKRSEHFDFEELTYNQKWERKEERRLRAERRAKQYPPEPVDESALKGYWYKDEARNTINRMTPIPLLPDELRGIGIEEVDTGCENSDTLKPPRHPLIPTQRQGVEGKAEYDLLPNHTNDKDNTHPEGPD